MQDLNTEPITAPDQPIVDRKESLRAALLETFETILLAVVLFLGINAVSARIRVDGDSMLPSFNNGDYVIVNRLAYRLGDFQRGDVIVFPYPNNPSEDYIKRIIALAGDTVSVQASVVYVNGIALDEPYINEPARVDYPEIVVPEGHVFVMGDNRNNSSDSRHWGPLPIEHIIGKALFVYWPFSDFGLVPHPESVFAAP